MVDPEGGGGATTPLQLVNLFYFKPNFVKSSCGMHPGPSSIRRWTGPLLTILM